MVADNAGAGNPNDKLVAAGSRGCLSNNVTFKLRQTQAYGVSPMEGSRFDPEASSGFCSADIY